MFIVIEQHDRSQPTVTLRFQIIEADGFTATDPAIADVEATLRKLFRFDGYRLLAEGVMSNVMSGSDVSQKVRAGDREFVIQTDVRATSRVPEGVSTADLRVVLMENPPNGSTDFLLQTGVRVPDGQTVVIGNAVPSSSDRTVILVVRPDIGD